MPNLLVCVLPSRLGQIMGLLSSFSRIAAIYVDIAAMAFHPMPCSLVQDVDRALHQSRIRLFLRALQESSRLPVHPGLLRSAGELPWRGSDWFGSVRMVKQWEMT